MAVRPVVKLTRKQIYDEVWAVAVSGMALKYSIPYAALLKQVKDANIPIPPSGYWTKKEFNKETTITELPGDPDAVIALYKSSAAAAKVKKTGSAPEKEPSPPQAAVPTPKFIEEVRQKEPPAEQALGEPEVEEGWGVQKHNIYRREILYKEVWQFPVTEVAKKYSVSDVAIHKICKSLEIPTPPVGYWAKLRAGKPMDIPPLPQSDRSVTKGLRTENAYTQTNADQLAHLSDEDREIVLAVASQLQLSDEAVKLHSKVAAYAKETEKGQLRPVTDSVSNESLPRVLRIVDTIVKAVEPLGVEVDQNLNFSIGQDSIQLRFSEATTEVPHQLTQEEKLSLLKYEDARKHSRWASKPNIRKYDHEFNGRISIGIGPNHRIRDSKSALIENRIGDLLVAVFAALNSEKLAREEREEAARKREEEERRKEELRKRYNDEIDKTQALLNQAEDYAIACKIRTLVKAVETQNSDNEETQAWIACAKEKADWYDPTIAAEDPLLGKRDHRQSPERKELKHKGGYWW